MTERNSPSSGADPNPANTTWAEKMYDVYLNIGFDFFPVWDNRPFPRQEEIEAFKWEDLDILKDEHIQGFGIKCGEKYGICVIVIPFSDYEAIAKWNRMISLYQEGEINKYVTREEIYITYPEETAGLVTPFEELHLYVRYDPRLDPREDLPNFPSLRTDGHVVLGPGSYDPGFKDRSESINLFLDLDQAYIPELNDSIIDVFSEVRDNEYMLVNYQIYNPAKHLPVYHVVTERLLIDIMRKVAPIVLSDVNRQVSLIYTLINMAFRRGWILSEAENLAATYIRTADKSTWAAAVMGEWYKKICLSSRDFWPTNGEPEFSVLISWLERYVYDKRIIVNVRKKWNLGDETVGLYDTKTPYYIGDYISDVNGRRFFHEEQLYETCVVLAKKCIRKIGGGSRYLIKQDKCNPLRIINHNPTKEYGKYVASYDFYYAFDKYGAHPSVKKRVKTMNIFDVLSDRRLNCTNVRSFPVSPTEIASDELLGDDTINIFPGYAAHLIENLTQEELEARIKPFTDHILRVLANNDRRYYDYIIRWIADLIQHPRNKRPNLCFIGTKGCGKSIFAAFIQEKVLGSSIAIKNSGLEAVTGRFNGIIEKIILYIAEELPELKNSRAQHDKFKHLSSDGQTMIENKHMEAKLIDNYVSYILISNYENSIVLDKQARRYAIFHPNDDMVGDFNYFKQLARDFSKEMADYVLTYATKLDLSDFEVMRFPRTEILEKMIKLTQPSGLKYIEAIRDREHHLRFTGSGMNVFFKDERPFMTCDDILSDYQMWCTRSNVGQCSSGVFYNDIANAFPEARDRKWIKGKTHRGYFLDMIIPEFDWKALSKGEEPL